MVFVDFLLCLGMIDCIFVVVYVVGVFFIFCFIKVDFVFGDDFVVMYL